MKFELPDPLQASSLKKAIDRKPPDVLFHYTKREGLCGILKSRSVYASHIRYLNDAHEVSHAINMTQSILKARISVTTGEQKQFYEELKQWIESLQYQYQVFVFSMSEEGDLLSQWRAYCNSSDGYAIGFDVQKLKQHADSQSFYLVPCVYDDEAQNALISQLIKDVNDDYQERIQSGILAGDAINQSSTYFILLFLILAPVLKAPAFKEEKEWRLISFHAKYGYGQPSVKYRNGRSLLIPFVGMEIAPKDSQLPIAEVVIGPTEETVSPTSHRTLEHQAVSGLLISENASGRTVRSSTVPYRSS